MAPKVKAPKPAPKKVDTAPKAAAEGAKAPVKAVQKAHKVQKKVVKGLHGTRFKKDQGRRLEAITEEGDSGDRQDDGVRDDQDQKFTLPIHETTNIVITACLIQKAVEEYSLVGDYVGE